MVLELKKKTFVSFLIGILTLSSIFSLEVPQLKGRVNDYANIIGKNDEIEIENYLSSLDSQTGIQLVVLTIPSLENDSLENFSMKVVNNWELGQGGKDNGVLLLISYDERKIRIETGYGLEDKLTDMKSGLIIRNVIVPEFKLGNYSEGIKKGVRNIVGIVSGDEEIVEKSVLEDEEEEGSVAGIFFMIVWIIFIIILISSRGGILKWILLSNLTGVNSGRNNSNILSNNKSFGGSTFSGGGGHFGGGGASGGW